MPSTSGLVSADVVTWRPKPTKSNTPLGIKVSQGLGVGLGVVTGASCATAKRARTNRIRTVMTAGCNERWIRLSIGRVVAFILRSFVIRVTKRLICFTDGNATKRQLSAYFSVSPFSAHFGFFAG